MIKPEGYNYTLYHINNIISFKDFIEEEVDSSL